MTSRGRAWAGTLLAVAFSTLPLLAQAGEPDKNPGTEPEPAEEASSLRPKLEFGLEAKANFRQSDENRFPVRTFLPPMRQAFLETVDSGSHFELSDFTLYADATWSEHLVAHAKIDFIDLYERNPTSTADKVDVDELWLRLGHDSQPAALPAGTGAYFKVGKFAKFERQNDRHLESYGLVSTSFNRIEDVGLELGLDLGRHVYLKGSLTQGNPVFLRDPNALAGDSGTPEFREANPNPDLQHGIVIPYDAATQDVDVDGNLQKGLGLGIRFASEDGANGLDVLVFGRRRTLADHVDFKGSFYGADIDLLNGPEVPFLTPADVTFPLTSDRKQEVGGNVWIYFGGGSFFGQYVDQDLGGLGRIGYEGELAWRFDLPLVASLDGRQLFPSIQPVVRYSKLDPDFRPAPRSPTPSFAWQWEKLDLGFRLTVISGLDVTAEYAKNDFILLSGAKRDNNETLVTVRWRI
ncbi:MAG TPA: hypothetical protein VN851_12795 [Thermoanaerobaculia bacterium]|nr:hypothetical protein [Thermoanaerobaculia bacterium]